MMNNQQGDSDMLQIAINSSERFTDDIPNPGIPDPFKVRASLEALLEEPIEGTSNNSMSWSVGPGRAVVEFYICWPGTRPPASCLDSKAIHSLTFRNVRDVVFSKEFYISALQLAQPDNAGL
jgi:hypothetical protein